MAEASQPGSLAELEADLQRQRFSMDPALYAAILRRLLRLPASERSGAMLERCYEALEGCVEMIANSFGGGTLTPADRQALVAALERDFRWDLPDEARSSALAVAMYLLPDPGALAFLQRIEASAPDEGQRAYVRTAATTKRDVPVV